ncbi:MAG: 30S ribosomal protein S5 [Phycisphaerae bacterium]|nr:30S ribosomal protein S5 [Phycisphaerae bacterium]
MAEESRIISGQDGALEETVVKVFRCAKVVKGGRRFSFSAMVAVGDRGGKVGIGYGKAKEVPMAVNKAIKDARKSLFRVSLNGQTIPHQSIGKFGATKIMLIPASPGTGVIAGSSARAVLELVGIHDVLTKVYGSTTTKNVVKATMDGLLKLRDPQSIGRVRGVAVEPVKRW